MGIHLCPTWTPHLSRQEDSILYLNFTSGQTHSAELQRHYEIKPPNALYPCCPTAPCLADLMDLSH